jgi:hypothetical protein
MVAALIGCGGMSSGEHPLCIREVEAAMLKRRRSLRRVERDAHDLT